MTQYQVNVMRLIFAEYKTPTMNECEQMGREINLKKRVVQVWFQNARAKEKKSQPLSSKSILFSNTANNDLSNYEFSPDECLLCSVAYNSTTAVSGQANSQAQRDHLFSKGHINKLIQFVTNVAVENGADLANSSKFFTGFHSSSSATTAGSSDSKRKFADDEDNESFDDEDDDSNGDNENENDNENDNEDNFIEYGESTEEQPSDAEEEPCLAARAQSLRKASLASSSANAVHASNYKSSNQLKNSNDSSFNSSHSSIVMPSQNSDDGVEQNEKAQTSSGGTGPYSDLGRLMQMQQQQGGASSQQQQLYNYLLYSNLLNNVKM